MSKKITLLLAIFVLWLCLFGCSNSNSPKYIRKEVFSEGLYKVESKEGKIGIIDSIGNIIVPVRYWRVEQDEQFNDLIHVYIYKQGLFDNKSGYAIISPEYDYIRIVKVDTDTLIIARKTDGGWNEYLFSRTGKQLTGGYTNIYGFSEGLSAVDYKQTSFFDTRAGFIDKTGKVVIPMVFNYAERFSEGLAAVAYNGRFGYTNHKGQEVIPYMFDWALRFSKSTTSLWRRAPSIAGVKLNGKWGFINKEGEVVIPFIYDKIGYVFDESCSCIEVQVKAERYFIDTSGNRYDGANKGFWGSNKID